MEGALSPNNCFQNRINKKKFTYYHSLTQNKIPNDINYDIENENKKIFYSKKSHSSVIHLNRKRIYSWKKKKDKIILKDAFGNKKLFLKLKDYDYKSILNLYLSQNKKLNIIDIFIVSILDIISLILLSLSYHLLLENNLKLNSKINLYRLIGLILSCISIIFITIRRIIYKEISILKYILNIKLKYPSSRKNIKKLFLEYIAHIIQPYPYITYNFIFYKDEDNNFTTIFSIDMIFVVLSFLRLYTLSRIFLITTYYRNIRIWNFYGNNNVYKKILKKFIQDSPILFYLIVLIFFLFTFSYIYSLLENIVEINYRYSFYNCLWIIIQSTLNSGFGDEKIKTKPTQIFLIFTICISLFLFSSFITSLLKLCEFSSEKELKAYQKIKIIYSKNEKNKSYNLYFEHYLKYKMTKVKETLKTHKINYTFDEESKLNIALEKPYNQINNNLFRSLDLKIQLKLLRNKYYRSFLAKLKFEPTITDFFNYIIKRFDVKMQKCIFKINKNINHLVIYHNFLCCGITDYYHNVIQNFYDSNKVTNLMLLIFWIGNKYTLNSYDELIKYKTIQLKEFNIKYKEFKLIYEDRIIKFHKNIESKRSKYFREVDLNNTENFQFDYDDYDDSDFDDYEYDSSETSDKILKNVNKKTSNGAMNISDNLIIKEEN